MELKKKFKQKKISYLVTKVSKKKLLPNPRAREKKGERKQKKKQKATKETENLKNIIEMSKEELIASRLDRSEKVFMNTKGERSEKLM